ncbi:DUF1002 domain-containing protein [Methanosphaera sp. ISO3-F5]|uniref:DUF1002 domain-containing protein n=1 Tax=Methanosphaera sp. ISO3-F5 TaxID=1452353 RepID=UPI002B25CB68|nr:DUF1002 domain-containing protein [Methanosphaera sp. ISO3-F5]WQH64256.1 DUF1002 domain-containing protein [Methanosphaera sp. ISO3-F5]
MSGKSICAIILVIIAVAIFVPFGSSDHVGGTSDVVVTYGETTYNNAEYKQIVNNYFNVNNAKESVITANDVNKISSDISQRTYNSNQIFSCAMVDVSGNNNIDIDVDTSKITTVTPSMYKSALDSAGITKGHVKITSPVSATGESALAGIMQSYEESTGTKIPDKVKDAANNEIYTQSEVAQNSNASADDIAKMMDTVKEEVAKENTTDAGKITNIVNNVASNNNIQISNNDINILVNSIQQTQSVKDQASQYQSQLSGYVNSGAAQSIFDRAIAFINSIINPTNKVGNTNTTNNSSNY